MNKNDIRKKIESFPVWHYQFNLKENLTPIRNVNNINRHLQRKKYFLDPTIKFLGDTLAGSRVLDLGCNAGYWSLQAIENGCDFVLGIDGRQMHIDQANFVFDVNQVDKNRYKFINEDIFEVNFKKFGSFDIVFFLGLMYHINKPIAIMEKISEVSSDILIIDTSVIKVEGSYIKIIHESVNDPRNAIDSELVFRPSRQAVFDIVQQFGYKVVMLKPQFSDYTGAEGYRKGMRRAFVCAKKTNLSDFPATIESLNFD